VQDGWFVRSAIHVRLQLWHAACGGLCLFYSSSLSSQHWLQAPANDPGPRESAVAVIDSSDQIWLMTGVLTGLMRAEGISDVWKFDTKALLWTWFVRLLAALNRRPISA
jgi:hypothetical protein